MKVPSRLGVGFIGSGFNTRYHIQSWTGVRDADVRGVYSPNYKNAASAAALANSLNVGPAKAYKSITEMIADPEYKIGRPRQLYAGATARNIKPIGQR